MFNEGFGKRGEQSFGSAAPTHLISCAACIAGLWQRTLWQAFLLTTCLAWVGGGVWSEDHDWRGWDEHTRLLEAANAAYSPMC